MNKYRMILASASPRRRELLSQIGLTFAVCPSRKEEVVTEKQPELVVEQLAGQKAADIFCQVTDEENPLSRRMREEAQAAGEGELSPLVVGADTIVCLDGQILGKPTDKSDAVRMLKQLQGRTHQVYTGVCLMWLEGLSRREVTFHVCTEVNFYPMSEEEITAYVETKDPMDKAGAYGIQGICAAHISGICGDYNNVVGLPVGELYQRLREYHLL